MSNLNAAGANNPKIKNVQYVTYLQEPSSGPVHLIVNKTQYVGKYPTLANAQEALEGILMRLGSKNPTTRRGQITTVTTDLTFTGDRTPAATNWTDITHSIIYDTNSEIYTNTYGTSEVQVTGINTATSFKVEFSVDIQLWVKVSDVSTVADITTAPSESTGYRRLYPTNQFIVNNNEYVRFKAIRPVNILNTSGTVTVVNTGISAIADTFVLAYTYSEIGGA